MNSEIYNVSKLIQPMVIDADWNKPHWKNVQLLSITNWMGKIPSFQPSVRTKMMYDDDNLFVIFRVSDRNVRCITTEINGPVWEDGCVEFFFAPDPSFPLRYFNLEVNCGGTPLMHYNTVARTEITPLEPAEIRKIEIAHSLPEKIDPEMSDQVIWTVEYRIPTRILLKYSSVTPPGPGVEWRANFYKIAENSSNPHYLTWSPVINPVPDFHRPEYFGLLKFQQ